MVCVTQRLTAMKSGDLQERWIKDCYFGTLEEQNGCRNRSLTGCWIRLGEGYLDCWLEPWVPLPGYKYEQQCWCQRCAFARGKRKACVNSQGTLRPQSGQVRQGCDYPLRRVLWWPVVHRHWLDLGKIWAFGPWMGAVAGGILKSTDLIGYLGLPFLRVMILELEQTLEVIDS